jgi:hypothetical protein
MKLKAIKAIHDEIMRSAIEQFNEREGLGPTMFFAEINNDGTAKDLVIVPDEITMKLFTSGPDEVNAFVNDALTEGTPLHKQIQSKGMSVNLVIQVAEATASTQSDPQERRVLMCLLAQTEGSFFVAHPINSEPVVHCIQAEFPAFETIRMGKAVAKSPEEFRPVRPTLH